MHVEPPPQRHVKNGLFQQPAISRQSTQLRFFFPEPPLEVPVVQFFRLNNFEPVFKSPNFHFRRFRFFTATFRAIRLSDDSGNLMCRA